mmetsp:Transcript_518/g.1871  ORF Transcript_518/g.1871 Transcript_518/m.1871 type:complete len:144 (-) Transcript_518:114-545(-)|eukprot:scaffold3350_cov268-Pinguiococcus_pyrenoidosus.AAC.33
MAFVLRPLFLPAAVAAGGVWYGAHNLTLKALSAILPSPFSKHSSSLRNSSFLVATGVSGGFLYFRSIVDPPPQIPVPEADLGAADTTSNIGRGTQAVRQWVSDTIHKAKTFPLRYHVMGIMAAGVVAGVVDGAIRSTVHGRGR